MKAQPPWTKYLCHSPRDWLPGRSGTAPIFAAVVFLALLLRGQVRRKRLAHHGSVLGPRRCERPITFPGLAFAVTLAVFASFQRLERNQFTFVFRCARVPVIFFPASPFSEVFCRLALPHTAAGEALDIPLVTQIIAFDVLRLALSFLTPRTLGRSGAPRLLSFTQQAPHCGRRLLLVREV